MMKVKGNSYNKRPEAKVKEAKVNEVKVLRNHSFVL